MKIKRIAHLGVAIKDLDPPKKLYGDNLKLEFKGDEVVSTQKVQVSFFKVGETSIELLLPTAEDSPVAKFLENKGEGFHHLALEVTVNGRDADDAASGPSISVGGSASFAYLITYTGNNIVYDLQILDPQVPESRISCSGDRTLRAGETLRCSATVAALSGPHSALVTAVSWDANGRRVTAEDWVYYLGTG